MGTRCKVYHKDRPLKNGLYKKHRKQDHNKLNTDQLSDCCGAIITNQGRCSDCKEVVIV